MNGGEPRVRRIAIFGKSHELWPVAALLAKDLPADIALIAVEDRAPVEPAAVSIRLDDPLLVRLGIGADELAMAGSALFSLGSELRDWLRDGSRFLMTGSGSLPPVADIAIHQIMLRAALAYDQAQRLAYLYQPFRLPVRAMEAGKFAFQSADPRSPLSMLRPSVQMDRTEYAALCRKRLGSGRTEMVEAKPQAVKNAANDRTIHRVELENGQAIAADFYIDVSGDLGRLTGDQSRLEWRSLAGQLPFDRIISAQSGVRSTERERHSVAQAIKGGLLITTPLRDRSITQLIYASGGLTGEEKQNLVGREAQETLFEPGYVRQPWIGNLARLGSASACLGPFLSADMTILQRQAIILADHLPTRLGMTNEAREFNRRHLIAVEQVRDFMLLPLALNRRDDVPWIRIEEGTMPESLIRKIGAFRRRGRFVAYEGEIFDEQSWIDLMIGFEIVPERYDPIAQSLDMPNMALRLKNLTAAFNRALMEMRSQEDVIGNPEANAPR